MESAALDLVMEVDNEARIASAKPIPLPELSPVKAFDYDLLPDALSPWAKDVSERLQCPPDFVAVGMMVAIAAVVGRKICIRPQERTTWEGVPNMWGCIVGRPGVLKSPALEEALKPLNRLIARAQEKFDVEMGAFKAEALAAKLRGEAQQKKARDALKKDPNADVGALLAADEPEPPSLRRYKTNDSSPEALAELLRLNPNGLMVYRDELISLLRNLDREDRAEARGFYLTGWNGDSPYTSDRIGRGKNLHISAVCISLLGGTQPGRISEYVGRAASNAAANDGLIQRFSLMVWPDIPKNWRDVDRFPNREAKASAFDAFDRLDRLDPAAIGAEQDKDMDGTPEGIPYLRFDAESLSIFRDWRAGFEARLRDGSLHPAMEEHLAKYRKLVPGLSLLCHLADVGGGPVRGESLLKALAWADYLETHAERVYGAAIQPDVTAAKAILRRIKKGDLPETFSGWQVWRPGWSGLDRERAQEGLRLLVEYEHLVEKPVKTGGRTKTVYAITTAAG